MKPLCQQAQPLFEELIRQAAQSPLIHHDDTPMRILDLRRSGSATAAQIDPQRQGAFTSNLLAHGLSHGRREFVSVAESFPDECRHVLQALGEVYRVDAQAKEFGMSPEQRLLHHQTHSQPVMARLQGWLQEQRDGKKAEPNSGLGQAIADRLKQWEPLTLFLRQAGAPWDNNRCEQALKTCRPAGRWPSCTAKTVSATRPSTEPGRAICS